MVLNILLGLVQRLPELYEGFFFLLYFDQLFFSLPR